MYHYGERQQQETGDSTCHLISALSLWMPSVWCVSRPLSWLSLAYFGSSICKHAVQRLCLLLSLQWFLIGEELEMLGSNKYQLSHFPSISQLLFSFFFLLPEEIQSFFSCSVLWGIFEWVQSIDNELVCPVNVSDWTCSLVKWKYVQSDVSDRLSLLQWCFGWEAS